MSCQGEFSGDCMIDLRKHGCVAWGLVCLLSANRVLGGEVTLTPRAEAWLAQTDSESGADAAPPNLLENIQRQVAERGVTKGSVQPSKVSPVLREIIAPTKGAAPSDVARLYGIKASQGRIGVVITVSPQGGALAVRRAIEQRGAVVRLASSAQLHADVAPEEIPRIASISGVQTVEPLWLDQAFQGAPATGAHLDGKVSMQLQVLHERGLKGRGIKIGIVDMGFEGYPELQRAGVLPQPRAAKAFGDEFPVFSGGSHGTSCAEIVHSVAPESDIYIARFARDSASAMEALQWLVDQDVDVISASWGSTRRGLDGNDPLDRYIDEIVIKHGVLFLGAAGNEAEGHWGGRISDGNRNGFVDVESDKGYGAADVLRITAPSDQGNFLVTVNWNDWGRYRNGAPASLDIDAYLLVANPNIGEVEIVGASEESQLSGASPLETILARSGSVPANAELHLVLKANRAAPEVPIHVYVRGAGISPSVAAGSVASPATARQAIAVGAVQVQDGSIASYSSNGPTDDGRLKPDIVAPTGVRSLAMEMVAGTAAVFDGTSAAAPHAAGFAALLRQLRPDVSVSDLHKLLKTSVRPLGSPIPNLTYGYGHLDARRVAIPRPDAVVQPPEGAPAVPVNTIDDLLDEIIEGQKASKRP